nr:MAG TPA: hypothetical protein [Caudoviricetes sp.]
MLSLCSEKSGLLFCLKMEVSEYGKQNQRHNR